MTHVTAVFTLWTDSGNCYSISSKMEKIGMYRHERDDFDHPRLPLGHPMRRHVLYRLSAEGWQAARLSRPRATGS